jgi:hypothetical protein
LGPGFIGDQIECEGHIITIDEDFVAGVNVMIEYISEAQKGADLARFEFRVKLDGYFDQPPPVPLFGSLDAALLSSLTETLEIVDYKNGAGVAVSPVENPQLLYYAAGVLAELPLGERNRVARIRATIVQPHAGGAPVRSWELGVVDLLMWIDEVLKPGVRACVQQDAPLNPGSWCRFCPAVTICPRLQADAQAMARREFDDALPGSPADLADALDIAERATLWAEKLREYATEQLQRQVRIPGWELVPTRPTRRWIDKDAAAAAALQLAGVDESLLWESRLRSPAQLERVLRRSKTGRQLWVDLIAEELVESVSSGVRVARSTRPAAQEEFADVD